MREKEIDKLKEYKYGKKFGEYIKSLVIYKNEQVLVLNKPTCFPRSSKVLRWLDIGLSPKAISYSSIILTATLGCFLSREASSQMVFPDMF